MTIKVQANSQNQWFSLRIIIEQRTSRYRAFKLSNSSLHENLIQLIEIMLGVFNGTGITVGSQKILLRDKCETKLLRWM